MLKQNPEQNKIKLLDALERSLGIVSAACKEVGISRNQFYKYIRSDNEFKEKVEEIQELQLDFVENQLLKNIKNGDVASIIFYMKTKGRKRGYSQNIDMNMNITDTRVIELVEVIKEELPEHPYIEIDDKKEDDDDI